METLLYVRHGTSELNLERRFGGRIDTPLSPQGLEEARLAGKLATNLTIDCIVSSPLSRCRMTAEVIAEEIGYPLADVIVSELLVERSFGPLEGTPLVGESELENVRGVETLAELADRATEAHAWITGIDAQHVLVCGHGVFGRALRGIFRPELAIGTSSSDGQRPLGIPNAVITCWHRRCDCCSYEELETIREGLSDKTV